MMNEAYFIAAQTSVVPIAWGMPGECKTRMIEDFARFMKAPYSATISLSEYEPTDIGGFPYKKTEERADGSKEEYTGYLKPEFIALCERHGTPENKAILFFDEWTNCQGGTRAAGLRILSHGIKNTLIMCAANPPSIAENGSALGHPVNNRLYHHDWEINHDEWLKGFMAGFPQGTYPKLPDNWKEYIPLARTLIASFLKSQSHSTSLPVEEFANRHATSGSECAWQSRRSWTNASELLGAAMSLGHRFDDEEMSPVCQELLNGTVGGAKAGEFFDWRKNLKMRSPEEVLDLIKRKKFTTKDFPKKSDEAFAFINYCLNFFVRDKKHWEPAWKFFEVACNAGHKDIAVACKDTLFNANADEVIPDSVLDILSETFDMVEKA